LIFADVIVDISHENLDKVYQYAVPENIREQVVIGSLVNIPFGVSNKRRTGYVVGLSDKANYPVEKIKPIEGIVEGSLVIESQLIQLAYWIKDNYGATMN
jgi:replication restart DNA helicase PriA